MVQWCLMGLGGKSFVRKAKQLNRQVYSWTVNQEKDMRWCIENELDGVIGDDPKKFLEVCAEWQIKPKPVKWTMGELYVLLKYQFLLTAFYFVFRWKFGSGIDPKFISTTKKTD
jgi:phosphatidylglycerol phospholipase C